MLEKIEDEEIYEKNRYESLNNFIEDSKELYKELTLVYKENIGKENKNIFFKFFVSYSIWFIYYTLSIFKRYFNY